MERFEIPEGDKTPKVLILPEQKEMLIEGNSRPEDVRAFYQPIIEKLEDFLFYLHKEDESFTMYFKMGYFNSSSAKFIADVLYLIVEYAEKGLPVTINWYYEKEDCDMKEAGEEFSDMIGFPFKYIES
jgi:hypothetical protein